MSAPAPLRDLLHGFAFDRLFNELGWDHFAERRTVQVGEAQFVLAGAAQKRGFVVLVCAPDAEGRIPASDLRRRIDREVTKLHREHLLVFVDAARTEQVWMFAHRQQGEPTRLRERRWQAGQTGDPILQTLQGFAVSLAEDDALTLVDVTRRNRQAAAVEKVTRKFYAAYKQEHDAFRGFVQGIKEQGDRAWYASVMLNRLMFVYFIQKKGFLDGNPDYLRDKLRQTQEQRGPNQFITFYRHFLLRLFHHGLGARKHERRKGLDALLGDVPYLNGGLFDVHQLERVHASMDVPDEAFARLFDFFDGYQWHLDERPSRADDEINPDVLGYIFEKYINQKQMGAYYTKEDITGYIGQNTIIPAVFDQARTNPEFGCAVGFRPDGALWGMLREHPDHYLYGSVKHGTDLPLPPEIAAGEADVAQRDGWNRLAAAGFALPTETWREHIARRQRCTEVRARLAAGAVTSVDDLITLNLDIRQFAEDAIARAEGSDLVWAFYQALRGVTVLDPTCGSGAFLFAALNILRPLYDACLDRMQGFLDDLERTGQPHWPETLRHFREELARIEGHPNRDAFVLKTIILNNLYGVDIMEEAVEICKLRLFLKQVAQVEDAADIESLPDIDFNIRAGNTLVGFATLDQVKAAITGVPSGQMRLLSADEAMRLRRIEEGAAAADRDFARFREMQTASGVPSAELRASKDAVSARLAALRDDLDAALANDGRGSSARPCEPEVGADWKRRTLPFHWFVEFYGILRDGGFSVVVGNPPYVESAKVAGEYTVRNYKTVACGNLYAFVVERSADLVRRHGRSGMIVPHSAFCTDRMARLMDLFPADGAAWISTFDIRPSKLFVGVDQRLAIYLHVKGLPGRRCTTHYHRWRDERRPMLFETLSYVHSDARYPNSIPKFGHRVEERIWAKLSGRRPLAEHLCGHHTVSYHNAPRYWIRAMTFVPYFCNDRHGEQVSSHVKMLQVADPEGGALVTAILNSSLFYWWFIVLSNCRDLTRREIDRFPCDPASLATADRQTLARLSAELMTAYEDSSVRKTTNYKTTGRVVYDEFYPRQASATIDRIDRILGPALGLDDEELDFVVNFDRKFRVGSGGEAD